MEELKYYEFYGTKELNDHLKYWSNACGDLHHHGQYGLKDASELPKELQRAYKELWKEGNGCFEYLAEFDGKYYVALVSEFDAEFAAGNNMTMDELYETVKKNALDLARLSMFRNTVLVLGKETGFEGCHEVAFLVPATEQEAVYDAIESTISMNICSGLT